MYSHQLQLYIFSNQSKYSENTLPTKGIEVINETNYDFNNHVLTLN